MNNPNIELTPEQVQQAVAHRISGAVVAQSLDNGAVLVQTPNGKSYTKMSRNELRIAHKQANHVDTRPRLSDELKQQIHAEKWGKRQTPAPAEPVVPKKTKDQLHREFVAKKYGIK